MAVAAFVFAAVSLALSLGLAALKLWETFWAKPDWLVKFDWIHAPNGPMLRVFITNGGHARDGISEIRFRSPDVPRGQGWTRKNAIMDKLPVMLGPKEITDPFFIEQDHSTDHPFSVALRENRVDTMVLTDTRGHEFEFDVPPPTGDKGMRALSLFIRPRAD